MIRTTVDNRKHGFSEKIMKQLDVEIIGPPILLAILLLMASIGPICSILSLMVTLPALLYRVRKHYSDKNQLKQTNVII